MEVRSQGTEAEDEGQPIPGQMPPWHEWEHPLSSCFFLSIAGELSRAEEVCKFF